MATELLGVAGMGAENKTYFTLKLLGRLVPALEHAQHGLWEEIPPHSGRQFEKRRYESIPAQTATLTEGTPPTSQINGTWTFLTFTVAQYGAYTRVSDVLTQQGFDGLEDMVNAMGENAGLSLDTIIRNSLFGAGTVQYASTAVSVATVGSGMYLNSTGVRQAVRRLRLNNAKTFDDGYYHAIIHPDTEFDLNGDSSVTSIFQYALPRGEDNPLIQGTVPVIYGMKFFRTSNALVNAASGLSGADVYSTFCFGKESYIVSRFSTQSVRVLIKPVGSAGALDPLEQFGTIGWKASLVAGVLNVNAMVEIRHAASLGNLG